MLCPSHSAGINKGKHILIPGYITYSEEKLLEFFGQVLIEYCNDVIMRCVFIVIGCGYKS